MIEVRSLAELVGLRLPLAQPDEEFVLIWWQLLDVEETLLLFEMLDLPKPSKKVIDACIRLMCRKPARIH